MTSISRPQFNVPIGSVQGSPVTLNIEWGRFFFALADNIVLLGDVTSTASGGSYIATLSNTGVTPGSYTYSSLTVDSKGRITSAGNASVNTAKLLGRATAGTGAVEEITLGTNLSFTGTTLNAAGSGGSSTLTTIYLAGADGEDGEPSLIQGPAGVNGLPGTTGAQGPIGPAVFLEAEAQDGDIGPPGPAGVSGVNGTTGAQGPIGPAVFLEAESVDGDPGAPGPAGPMGLTGAQGPTGPALFLLDDPPEPEMSFPQSSLAVSGATGTSLLDFGAFPGVSDVSLAVTGQGAITALSSLRAWIFPAATVDHTADEHIVETLAVFAANIVAGTGFTLYGRNTSQLNDPVGMGTRLYGKWNVGWRWN